MMLACLLIKYPVDSNKFIDFKVAETIDNNSTRMLPKFGVSTLKVSFLVSNFSFIKRTKII